MRRVFQMQAAMLALLLGSTAASAQSLSDIEPSREPLVLQSQGSFFVGGRTVRTESAGWGDLKDVFGESSKRAMSSSIRCMCNFRRHPSRRICRSSSCTAGFSPRSSGRPRRMAAWAGSNISRDRDFPPIWPSKPAGPGQASMVRPLIRSRTAFAAWSAAEGLSWHIEHGLEGVQVRS